MGTLTKIFLRGLAAVLPLAITVYFIYWLVNTTDLMIGTILPEESEFPGRGIAFAIFFIVLIGMLMHFWLIRWFYNWGVSIVLRIPLIKTIYSMLRDMMGFFSHSEKKSFSQVVIVQVIEDGPEMLAFVTKDDPNSLHPNIDGTGKVAVYLPMSYQIGGFLMLVDKERVKPVDMAMDEALRLVLTAGMGGQTEATSQ